MAAIEWNGFKGEEFEFEGKKATVIFPNEADSKRNWALKTEYWNAFPNAEIELLNKGFHMAHIENDNRWATDVDVDRKARFVEFIIDKYNLCSQCALVGMSCGGMYAVKFAERYPQFVSCIYADAPVINFMSCPAGFGKGRELYDEWFKEISEAIGFETISDLLNYRESPIYKLDSLAGKRIPMILVAGDSDMDVPFDENGILLQRLYEKHGIEHEVYVKPGCEHHPHGMDDPTPIVNFILKHS